MGVSDFALYLRNITNIVEFPKDLTLPAPANNAGEGIEEA
jgi:hypothetical protein